MLFLGSASGLGALPVWEVESDEPGAFYGVSVTGAGDVNGDGHADFAVGCRGCDTAVGNTGKVFVYYGGPGGSATVADVVLEGANVSEAFGQRVAGAGDFDGDGYADLAVSAPGYDGGRGRILVYVGSPAGLTLAATHEAPAGTAGGFGARLAGGGDFDGDGFDDVVATASETAYMGLEYVGIARVIFGAASEAPAWSICRCLRLPRRRASSVKG